MNLSLISSRHPININSMRTIFLAVSLLYFSQSFAQYDADSYASAGQGGSDLFYYKGALEVNRFRYKEDLMNETGILPGFRGEIGWNINSNFALSLGGSYYDGSLTYDGRILGTNTLITQITSDYIRDIRLLLNYQNQGFKVSFGIGDRELFNDLIVSYTRTQTYRYYPLRVEYSWNPFYTSVEYRIWGEGKNVSTASKVTPGDRDLEFTQDSGYGYALEIGVRYPFGPFEGEIHLIYDVWEVADSSVAYQVDNTAYVEPENNSQAYILGIGIQY